MDVVTIRELSRSPAQVLARLRSGPLLVTQGGRPVAALHALDVGDLEDFVLANAPAFVRSMREADEALAEGRVRPASQVLAELSEAWRRTQGQEGRDQRCGDGSAPDRSQAREMTAGTSI